jgi:hypothetical protein
LLEPDGHPAVAPFKQALQVDTCGNLIQLAAET